MDTKPFTTPTDQPPSAERRLLVHLSIAVVGFIFVAVVALLFWRSYIYGEPNALWVIQGDPSLDGAVITIEGADGIPRRRAITAADNYIARIPVPPDIYSIKIVHRGRIIYHNPAARVGAGQYGLVPRESLLSATQPATRPR